MGAMEIYKIVVTTLITLLLVMIVFVLPKMKSKGSVLVGIGMALIYIAAIIGMWL